MIFRNDEVKRAVQEILEQSEVTRRAEAKRRHDIYKDGGRRFLIEQIRKEFGEDAVTEMRLAPINLLKKIINKRSQVYKKAPQRICELESDQQLLDYYVEELKVNELFQKVNRYYNLLSNTCIYVRPNGDEIKADVVPSYLYSVKANEVDQTKIEGFIFSSFKEDSMIATQTNLTSATGYQTLPLESGFKTTGDLIASQEKDVNLGRT
jgi:polyhydroxyalkanoate synthesis regulator phasin